MVQRPAVFVSYSHKDEKWRKRLEVHLAPYARLVKVEVRSDANIQAGAAWRRAIGDATDRAAALILLISADFLASEFVTTNELPHLLGKAQKDGAKVLLIIVNPCSLNAHPELARFQALNSPDRPLTLLKPSRAEEVLARAAEHVA